MPIARRAVVVGVVLFAVFVGLGLLLLIWQGVEKAGAWAGVIGLLGVPAGLSGMWLAWPRELASASEQGQDGAPTVQHVSADHGSSAFGVVNGDQHVYTQPGWTEPGSGREHGS